MKYSESTGVTPFNDLACNDTLLRVQERAGFVKQIHADVGHSCRRVRMYRRKLI